VWDSAPEILLPGDQDDTARRGRWSRGFRWAAMILVVIGAGQMAKSVFAPGEPELQLSERDLTPAQRDTPTAVVSPEERGAPQAAAGKASSAPANSPVRTTAPAPGPKALADAKAPDETGPDTAAEALARADLDTAPVAEQDTAPLTEEPALAAAAPRDTTAAPATSRDTAANERPTPAADLATRQAAAAALEELDRERLRSRANAATASLPPTRQELPPAAPAPPPPRTLEQKSQIYLRIGLDEAVKQLGHPMHVIEAMTPEFVGLAQGRLVPGADPTRPVVRVVYRDTRGRMILLDQQRVRPGQAPGAAAGNLRWTQGDVMLYLHGEPGIDVLRNLQRRVR
ncbi:MAG TPA: hypothetical protein VJ808_09940, partial [Gemmatimonadales bacterium]|nr:hypothetical protein [Gemmatimonadales bacterium]